MNFIAYIVFALFVISILIFLKYRIATSRKTTGESEVKYKVIEIGKNDFFRYSFENLFGNKRVYLKEKLENIEWLYVSKKDYNLLCPDSPLKMKEANHTIKIKYETQQLIFGGYGLAKIISHEMINKKPEVSKS
ncbi:hypothetical protein [Maribacter sp. Asnod2-G09]|uniref:hypothetical protein n=1 Tax=Maribacter sp. Asnod2-G09 TaxID=3160577 RepID=UPI00386BA380